MPSKIFSLHCLENESNVLNVSNTEGAQISSDLPQASDSESVMAIETEITQSKSLAVLQIDRETTPRENEKKVVKSTNIASQECLLLSNDEGSERLEKFLPAKLDSLTGEGLETIVEADFSLVLESLDK